VQQYNCYSILASVRHSLNEFSDAYVQGTDTTGRYKNDYLLDKINEAHREIYSFLSQRLPHYFMGTATLTGVNSVYTLPGDFGALVEFRNEIGRNIFPVGWTNRKLTGSTGAEREYYRNGNTLVINKNNVTTAYTLYYKKKCRNLEIGQAVAGSGAAALVMAATAKKTDDYYNGFEIENVTQEESDTITDYVASTQTATITGTPVADDWYGLVPEIPEMFMHLIQRRATMLVREEYPLSQIRNASETYQAYVDQMSALLINYSDLDADVPVEETFEDFLDD